MKRITKLTLLIPMMFTFTACNVDSSSLSLPDISTNGDYADMVKNFLYDSSTAKQNLDNLAATTGYNFRLRVEDEVIPDPSNTSLYFDIDLSGKGNLTWTTVYQKVKNGNEESIAATYYALLEEDTNNTYVSDGTSWYYVSDPTASLPYTIQDIKDLLIISGQYIPLLALTGVVKVRTMELNRECIKYRIKDGEDELTLVVDRKTQLLTHITDIKYVGGSCSKRLVKMTAFNEVAPNAPRYK